METRRLARWPVWAGLVVLCSAPSSPALIIDANYGNFSGTELLVLQDAVAQWSRLLPCNDAMTVEIDFVCDNALSGLGLAEVWFDGDGFVENATVTLNNDDLYWALTEPDLWGPDHEDDYDALAVAKHEVGHAIGFIHGGKFMDNVEEVGTNRFYDMNDDGVFNDNDFDLQDGDDWDGHAASSSDLMYFELPPKTRRHPTLHHAQVLGDAYGYCVIPEPTTLMIWLVLGGLAFASNRIRRG